MNTRFSHLLVGGLLGLGLATAAQADTIGRLGFVADTQIKLDEPASSNVEDEREGDGYDFVLFDTTEPTVFLFEFNTVEFDDEENDGIRMNLSQLSGGGGLNYAYTEKTNLYWMVTLDARMFEVDDTNIGASNDTDIQTGVGVRVGAGTQLDGGITLGAEARFSQIEDTSAYFFSFIGTYNLSGGLGVYAEYEFGDYNFDNGLTGVNDDDFDVERSDLIIGISYNFSPKDDD